MILFIIIALCGYLLFFQQGQSPQTAKDKPSASSRTSSQQPNRP